MRHAINFFKMVLVLSIMKQCQCDSAAFFDKIQLFVDEYLGVQKMQVSNPCSKQEFPSKYWYLILISQYATGRVLMWMSFLMFLGLSWQQPISHSAVHSGSTSAAGTFMVHTEGYIYLSHFTLLILVNTSLNSNRVLKFLILCIAIESWLECQCRKLFILLLTPGHYLSSGGIFHSYCC